MASATLFFHLRTLIINRFYQHSTTFLLLFFVAPVCQSQVIDTTKANEAFVEGSQLFDLGEYSLALAKMELAATLFTKKMGQTNVRTADALLVGGRCKNNLGSFQESTDMIKMASTIYARVLGRKNPKMGEVWYELAKPYLYINGDSVNYYTELSINLLGDKNAISAKCKLLQGFLLLVGKNDHKNGGALMEQAMNQQIQLQGEYHYDMADTYQFMSIYYRRIRDYDKMERSIQKALSIYLKHKGELHPDVGAIFNDLGLFYKARGDYGKAGFYFQKSLENVSRNLGENDFRLGTICNNLGSCLAEQGKYEDAIEQYKKAVTIKGSQSKPMSNTLAYFNLGHSYLKIRDYDLAMKNLQIALKCPDKIERPLILLNIGNVYLAKGNLDSAMKYYDESLEALHFEPENPAQNIRTGEEIQSALRAKGTLYYMLYQEEKKLQHLIHAEKYYDLLLESVENSRRYLTDTKVKLKYFDEFYGEYYEGALKVQVELYNVTKNATYFHKAFHLAESSKATQLVESINREKAFSFAGVPDSLENMELAFRKKLVALEKERHAFGDDYSSQKMQEILKQIVAAKAQHDGLLNEIKDKYPDYFRLKYDFRTVGISVLQKEILKPGQALVEYVVGQQKVWTFVVKPDTFFVQEIDLDFPLQDWVSNFRKGLYGGFVVENSTKKLQQSEADRLLAQYGFKLYQTLLAPLGVLPEKLIIVPDGVMSYVPFDALLFDKVQDGSKYNTWPFLLHRHEISYNYSATLGKEMSDRHYKSSGCLTVAPMYKLSTEPQLATAATRGDLGELLNNDEEASFVKKIMGGKLLSKKMATLEEFIKYAANYRAIHLAQHAILNDKDTDLSYLAFTEVEDSLDNERLYLSDLYAMQLPADLVFISACETGLGSYHRGEGILSLARGFSFAGAKSLVTTLWKVNDKASLEIVKAFYKNLSTGMGKDKALRMAKLAYLGDHKEVEAHPFYWAGFIPIGDMAAMPFDGRSTNWIWWVAGALGIVLVYFGWDKARSPR